MLIPNPCINKTFLLSKSFVYSAVPCVFRNHTHCNSVILFEILLIHVWSCVYEQSSADDAFNQLTTVTAGALNLVFLHIINTLRNKISQVDFPTL